MALGDNYVESDDLKEYLGIKPNKISNEETLVTACSSASREVERICNRQFNKADSATARLYQVENVHRRMQPFRGIVFHVDDFYDLAGLTVEFDPDGGGNFQTVDPIDYEVFPLNGVVDGTPGWPYNKVQIRNTWAIFPRWARLRITAKWGWESVPADVLAATMILAADTYQQKDSPYGVMADQYGVTLRPSGPSSGAGTQARLKLSRYARNRIQVA